MDRKQKKYCKELVYSTELGRQRYIDFINSTSTNLTMDNKANQLPTPPRQSDVVRGGYMYSNRLCAKNKKI